MLSDTTQVFENETKTKQLIVYTNVPGLQPSEFYNIRVRSMEVTNNEWVDCFVNITRNRASEFTNHSTVCPANNYAYQWHTDQWTQSYANIAISGGVDNDADDDIDDTTAPIIEVEISAKNHFQIHGKDFYKAATHPAHKVLIQPTVDKENGNVYFTINQTGQIVIDINGNMDDFNKAFDSYKDPTYVSHSVSLFVNPIIIDKPEIDGIDVVAIEPINMIVNDPRTYNDEKIKLLKDLETNKVVPPDPNTYTTMYFKPGIHYLGGDFKIYPNKNYYIPGDAIVYGKFTNEGVTIPDASVLSYRIFGHGTLSGEYFMHYQYKLDGYINVNHLIQICSSARTKDKVKINIEGLSMIDSSNFNFHIYLGKEQNLSWIKVVSWRANGDGVGGDKVVQDSFIRASDDSAYIYGTFRRCTFWRDNNAAVFAFGGRSNIGAYDSCTVVNSDILYLRNRKDLVTGIFQARNDGAITSQKKMNLFVSNIRIHDPKANMPIFNFVNSTRGSSFGGDGDGYSGLVFQNICMKHPIANYQQYKDIAKLRVDFTKHIILGHPDAIYSHFTFDNVVIGGKKITDLSDFIINEHIDLSTFVFK